jgi:hypothetical protein
MNFFKALIAKLTGGAEAPKTLDQARATFGEAKGALDKIGALFTNAAINLDDLLAKGENSLKDFFAELNAKVTTAQASLALEIGKVTATEAKFTEADARATAANAQVTALNSLFESIGFKPAAQTGTPAEQVAALSLAFKTHISGAVTQQLQELGQPVSKLPTAMPADSASKELTHAEFSKLTPAAKMEFCTTGGKITNLPVN